MWQSGKVIMNKAVSLALATPARKRIARLAMVGAGLGATVGAMDNMFGQGKMGIIGGTMRGAFYGTALGVGKTAHRIYRHGGLGFSRPGFRSYGKGRIQGLFTAGRPWGVV